MNQQESAVQFKVRFGSSRHLNYNYQMAQDYVSIHSIYVIPTSENYGRCVLCWHSISTREGIPQSVIPAANCESWNSEHKDAPNSTNWPFDTFFHEVPPLAKNDCLLGLIDDIHFAYCSCLPSISKPKNNNRTRRWPKFPG